MIYSDNDIIYGATYRELAVIPWNSDNVQPASYDLTLGSGLLTYSPYVRYSGRAVYDPLTDDQSEYLVSPEFEDHYELAPGEFVLGTTMEQVVLGPWVAGTVMGKSSLGRAGLIVHATAGFVDPGFKGQITLEMTNISPVPIRLTVGMLIAQIAFSGLKTATDLPYGHPARSRPSKYQNQVGTQASKGVVSV